jgi:hypothetical protein
VNYAFQETFGSNVFNWEGTRWFKQILQSDRFHAALGHLRFKRLDFVNRFYDIHTLSDFTLDKLIEHTKMLGLRNKKELRVVEKKEWFNIARVYYHVRDTKLWINT